MALHTLFGKLVHTVLDDIAFIFNADILFGFDFHPKTLTVKAVLVLARAPQHCVVTDVDILERTPPGMMDAHGIVGGYGAVEEGKPFR